MKSKPVVAVVIVIIVTAILVWRLMVNSQDANVIVLSGFIEGTEVVLRSEAAGQVDEINIKEGHRIAVGDVIANLDSHKAHLELNASEAELAALETDIARAESALVLFENSVERNVQKAQAAMDIANQQLDDILDGYPVEDVESARLTMELAKRNLDFAQNDFNRFKSLFEKGVISENEFEKAERAFNAAQKEYQIREETYRKLERGFDAQKKMQAEQNAEIARLNHQDAIAARDEIELKHREIDALKSRCDALRSKIELGHSRIADYTICSPIDGIITRKHVEAGELVSMGTAIVTLIKPDEKWIRVYVPATYLGSFKSGDELPIKLDAFPDHEFTGRISYISEEAEFTPKNVQIKKERVRQVYEVRMDIIDDAHLVKTGMEGNVYLNLKGVD
ncbi:HlyD family efflux transporter periplasmic adaptor subunit [bacterium]|nr:HlyD family efflux transporter periplasmic adaptor subunit [bacterium]